VSQRERGTDGAETLAVEALGFIASDHERLVRFLDLTGLSPATIRSAAGSPQFLTAVLDHLLGDERLLMEFAAQAGCEPAGLMKARDQLAGPLAFGLRDG
jgi:hypothetical protein